MFRTVDLRDSVVVAEHPAESLAAVDGSVLSKQKRHCAKTDKGAFVTSGPEASPI